MTSDGAQNCLTDASTHADCVAYVNRHACSEIAGVFGPESISWGRMREPQALLGAIAAVLLQMAHPAVVAGVSAHSRFANDVLYRARRTTLALYEIVFGTLSTALRTSERLHTIHSHVQGIVEEPGSRFTGKPYRANDQELLRWVAATTYVTTRQTSDLFFDTRPAHEVERDYQEFVLSAAVTGVHPSAWPATSPAFRRWYDSVLEDGDLVVGNRARSVAQTLFDSRLVARNRSAVHLTTALLPARLRHAYGLAWGPSEQADFERIVRQSRAVRRWIPTPYRYVVAWHQATVRLARSAQHNAHPWSEMLSALGARMDLPTALPALKHR